jgi:hypothetical protein
MVTFGLNLPTINSIIFAISFIIIVLDGGIPPGYANYNLNRHSTRYISFIIWIWRILGISGAIMVIETYTTGFIK